MFSYKEKLTISLTCPGNTGPMFIHAYASGEAKHQQVRTVTLWMQKSPYALLKRTNTFLPGNTQYRKGSPPHPLPIQWEYLIVQMPGLVVIFITPPAEDRLVVHLDQLPFRTETEVPKNSEHERGKKNEPESDRDILPASK